MRFTFLGTGTSAGVPAIGCGCAVCTSPDPRDTRLRTAAAIEFVDPTGRPRTILIDAGPDLRQQALRHRLTRCDAILFTHNHVDHTFGLDEVRRFNVVQQSPVEIYAEEHTQGFLRRVYQHIFDSRANINDSFVATLVPWTITPATPIGLFGLSITPIRLLHGKLPIVGFRVERDTKAAAGDTVFPLAYCTDVSAIPPESYPLLRGLRTLVLDALRHRHHPTHLTVAQALDIAERVNAERTYFTHMAHDLPHEATEAELPDRVRLAFDGLVLEAPCRP